MPPITDLAFTELAAVIQSDLIINRIISRRNSLMKKPLHMHVSYNKAINPASLSWP